MAGEGVCYVAFPGTGSRTLTWQEDAGYMYLLLDEGLLRLSPGGGPAAEVVARLFPPDRHVFWGLDGF